MHRDYKNENMILGVTKQHKIMIFIGNGFDIEDSVCFIKDMHFTTIVRTISVLSKR